MNLRFGDVVDVLKLPVGAAATLLLFLFSVQLLGTATDVAAPVLERVLRRVVVGDISALGLSWLASYVLANGSVVAALSLSLFNSGVLSDSQLFLMVAGSRLGGSAIVVFVGALDYFQKREYSLRSSISMGLLTFLLTHSIYVPATVVGYVSLSWLRESPVLSQEPVLRLSFLQVFEPATVTITTRIGPGLSFVFAVALLFGSLRMFDRLLEEVETEKIRQRLFVHFKRTWLSFVFGLVLTTVTTSVAFSLGVIVPLYNREFVKRDELVPYILGANIGTLMDTIVVALVLESTTGVAVVLFLLALASSLTFAALLLINRYNEGMAVLSDRLISDRRAFVAFVASLVIVPLAFLLVPLVLN